MRPWRRCVGFAALIVCIASAASAQQAGNSATTASAAGTGLTLSVTQGALVVASVSVNGPAARAGVAAGDRILRIDGTPTTGISIERASALLSGAAKANLTLTIQPAGTTRQLDVTLVRESSAPAPLRRRWVLPPPAVVEPAEPALPGPLRPLEMKRTMRPPAGTDKRSAADVIREAARTRDVRPLSALIAQGPSVVPDLTIALADADPAVRGGAAAALGQVDPVDAPAIRAVLAALRDSAPAVRRAAVRATGAMLGRATVVLPVDASAMVPLLSDPDKTVRDGAAIALRTLGPKGAPALPALWALLERAVKSPDDRPAGYVLYVVPATGAAALTSLRRYVLSRGTDGLFNTAGAAAVAATGPDVIPEAAALFQDPRQDVRIRVLAIEVLTALEARAAPGIPALTAVLGTRDPREIGSTAAIALGRIGRPAVPALVAALRSADRIVRENAALGLAQVGAEAAPALDLLIPALNDDNWLVQLYAVQVIGNVGGSRARETIPTLLRLFNTRVGSIDGGIRLTVAVALTKLNAMPDSMIPFLIERLEREDEPNLMDVAEALGNLGPRARRALPALRKFRERPSLRRVERDNIDAIIRKIESGR